MEIKLTRSEIQTILYYRVVNIHCSLWGAVKIIAGFNRPSTFLHQIMWY